MKIVSIVGARPQFIKLSMVSREIRKCYTEIIIHTGQHYDFNMSKNFFKEMNIPLPDVNLGIGSMSHGLQIGKMIQALEKELLKIGPGLVMVYGDTNTTLAGGLAASKIHIPVAHVEAGLRSGNKCMPEELNRILTDHLSSFFFCPSENTVNNLHKENIREHVFNIGDVMLDSLKYFEDRINEKILKKYGLEKNEYCLATIHRAENTNDIERLRIILKAFSDSKEKIIFSIHPRTRELISRHAVNVGKNVKALMPLGYLDMLCLEKYAKKIITDSGGIQKEAYYFKVPCLTIRDETEWIETVKCGANQLLRANKDVIVNAITKWGKKCLFNNNFYGTGIASKRILEIINKYMK